LAIREEAGSRRVLWYSPATQTNVVSEGSQRLRNSRVSRTLVAADPATKSWGLDRLPAGRDHRMGPVTAQARGSSMWNWSRTRNPLQYVEITKPVESEGWIEVVLSLSPDIKVLENPLRG